MIHALISEGGVRNRPVKKTSRFSFCGSFHTLEHDAPIRAGALSDNIEMDVFLQFMTMDRPLQKLHILVCSDNKSMSNF
jgi:hypothetical protein